MPELSHPQLKRDLTPIGVVTSIPQTIVKEISNRSHKLHSLLRLSAAEHGLELRDLGF